MRLSPEQLDELLRRRATWEKEGRITVRTHRISDAPPMQAGADLQEVARIAASMPAKPLHQVLADLPAVHRARKPKPSKPVIRRAERHVLRDCLDFLGKHPKVHFAFRQNTGMAKWRDESTGGERGVRFSFKGCSDILGMTTSGRFIAIECKATGRKATPEQQAFLDNVNEGGGIAICVDDVGELVQLFTTL